MQNELKNAKLFICDMDGTVYLGERVLDGALEFVKLLKEKGKELLKAAGFSAMVTDWVLRTRSL